MNNEISKDKKNQTLNDAKNIAIENKGELRYQIEWIAFCGLFIAFSSFFAGFGISAAKHLIGLESFGNISISILIPCILVLFWQPISKKLKGWYLHKEIDIVSKNAI